MTNDQRSFLRAIADQPADRTARLVFADFLEETGNATDATRAAFIRTQVETDTVHPNSNRHAELEARARELFTAHWLDWWAPACAAVGLPVPHRPSGVRGWLTRRLGSTVKPGFPYTIRWPVAISTSILPSDPIAALHRIEFAGGFPEALTLSGRPGFTADFLPRWANASPLAGLDLRSVVGRDARAIDGPHLQGLRTLRVSHNTAAGLEAIAGSLNLPRLESLHLDPDRANFRWPAEVYQTFADSPLARRVTRLSVVLADVTEALAFHGAPLGHLTALEIRAPQRLSDAEEFARAALATVDLLSLPHLDHVEELTLDAVTSRALGNADRAVLGRLRKLELAIGPAFLLDYTLNILVLPPNLTDLSVTIPDWSVHWLQVLAKSHVVGRLHHLRLDGHLAPDRTEADALMRLMRALDASRLETLRLGEQMCPVPTVRAALTERFGARVRFG
jgi:uncharacterized protein (TIGR02996 family)